MKEKLVELRKTERHTRYNHVTYTDRPIMVGSVLTVHVIDGRDLSQGNTVIKPVLQLAVGDYSLKTSQLVRPTNDPVWDEDFVFDIKTGQETLKVVLFDGYSRVPGSEIEISLSSLSENPNEID